MFLDFNSEMMLTGNDWVLANINVSGYFRVNYDPENWDRLISILNSNHSVRHCFKIMLC